MTPTLPEALATTGRLRDERLKVAESYRYSAAVPSDMQAGYLRAAKEYDADAAALTRVLAEVQRLREALPTKFDLLDAQWGHRSGPCINALCDGEFGRMPHSPDCWIARLTALLETPDGR